MDYSAKIIESWNVNAEKWITTINNEEIESRKLVTNKAIIDAVMEYHPENIIDIGCGEGWLTRELQKQGLSVFGIDGIESLINNATDKGGEHYAVCSYNDLVAGKLPGENLFSAAVINFALIDKEDTEKLIHYLPCILQQKGLLFIQTLHPISAGDEYKTGWKEGSWNGMKQNFTLPYKWYFRTIEDWILLFSGAGFFVEALKEPIHPATLKPASLIFILRSK
ncbi:MAG: class I SAM-dependent methyltransferase [Bacteroidota bacterium]|nr:class I SAM-dependent methyltransferase [Bacteroidota bacterium]